ncbi:MAG: TRAP transporter substrate-binding protein [Rhodospirillales bacterium]|nr:TRAP transporter substrate-binding protein [Rhodospirillales bacterium]
MFTKKFYLALLGAVLFFGIGGVNPAKAVDLKLSHFLPPGHTMHKALLTWVDVVKKKSGGKINITIFPAGQMGPMPRQFDLARTGVADMALSLHGGTPGRYPMTEVAQLPFLVKSSEVASRALTELTPKYLAKEYKGMKALWSINVPPLNLNMAKKKISKVSDFKGLRIRHAGKIFAAVVKKLGGTPVAVRPAQAADALAKGTVDGALFPFEAAMAFKLGAVCDYVVTPGFDSATFSLMINEAKYKSLSAEERKILDSTTGVNEAGRIGALLDKAEIKGREYMAANSTIITLKGAELEKFRNTVSPVTEELLKELEAKGLPAREFHAKFKAMNAM